LAIVIGLIGQIRLRFEFVTLQAILFDFSIKFAILSKKVNPSTKIYKFYYFSSFFTRKICTYHI